MSLSVRLVSVMLAILVSPHDVSAWSSSPLDIRVLYIDGFTLEESDRPWEARIRDPGGSAFMDSGKPRVGLAIPSVKLAKLRATLERERFFNLRDYYGDMVVDGPERTMEVRLGGRTKTVKIYSISPPTSKSEAAELARVMKVWHAITSCLHLQGHAAA